jgi:uncharacterized protein (PEP-CTERM system associated)
MATVSMVRKAPSTAPHALPWAPPAAGLLALAALAAGVPSARAQQGGLTITPGFSVTQTFTDNRNLSATDRQAESVTVLSPRVQISSRSGRVRGALDYSLNGVIYARNSSANSVQNALSAVLNAEVVERHAFIDARASISRQSISALDLQGNRPDVINPNSTELRTFSVSPSLRGRLFGNVDVEAMLSSSISSSADHRASDTFSHSGTVRIGDSSRRLGWSLSASRSISDYEGGRSTTQDSFSGQLSYNVDPTLRFFVSAGTERNDVLTVDQSAYDTWGGGFAWQPTPRTQFSLQGQRHYYGNSRSLNFSHRMRRSVVTYTETRSISESASGAGVSLSLYELYFIQFASLEPDPVLRDIRVRDFLLAAGLDPNQRLTGGFLNTALTVQTSRNLSLAVQGLRSNLVITAFATDTRRADKVSTAQDDLSQVGVLLQHGVNVSVSHRLTPTSAVVVSGSHQRTRSSRGVPGNGLRSLNLSWSGQVARQASVSLSARHSQANGANEYKENTLSAALNLSF